MTPESSEHRVFIWVPKNVLIQGSLFCICSESDVTFGILSSRIHEVWSTAQGNRLGAGNQRRYNIGVTFETFPFPDGMTPAGSLPKDTRARDIADAARKLDQLRCNWLNPSDFVRQESEVVESFHDRLVPVDDRAASLLRRRTLTDLYNQRPTWLANAHADLDRAVSAAYSWPHDLPADEVLQRLLELNLARSVTPTAPASPRACIR